jgi:ATP-dependent DNA helicase RecQ
MMADKPRRDDYASWQYQQFYDDSLAWETDPLFGWCNKHTKKDGSHYNIYTDGLKIYTTINSRMQEYAESGVCRRRILLNYFSEQTVHDCGNCDICENPPQHFDGTRYVQMALSAIKRTDETVRISTVIEILKGMRSPAVVRHHYDEIKTFGVGKDVSTNDWQDYLLQMLQMGFIEIAYNDGHKVKVTPLGEDILYGRSEATLCVIDHSAKEAPKRKPRLRLEIPTITIPGLPPTTGIEDPKLFEALRHLRTTCADEEGFPPYIVFSDKVLHSLATIKPTTIEQFGAISGIGEHKKQKYGARFLALIQKYV